MNVDMEGRTQEITELQGEIENVKSISEQDKDQMEKLCVDMAKLEENYKQLKVMFELIIKIVNAKGRSLNL